jgi:hypothetical protein
MLPQLAGLGLWPLSAPAAIGPASNGVVTHARPEMKFMMPEDPAAAKALRGRKQNAPPPNKSKRGKVPAGGAEGPGGNCLE